MGSSDRQPRLVMLGPPASGKGTHGRCLAARLGVDYLSTGSLLRREVQADSKLGRIAAPILEQGRYLPDHVMCNVIDGWISHHTAGWVLDGFPRSAPQAEFLDARLARTQRQLDVAVLLEVPMAVLWSRLAGRMECSSCPWAGQESLSGSGRCPDCGQALVPRPDDDRENFLNRHREYERLTLPAVDWYHRTGRLVRLDASGSLDEVSSQLLQAIEARLAFVES